MWSASSPYFVLSSPLRVSYVTIRGLPDIKKSAKLVHLSIQPAKEPFVARIFKGLSELESGEELVRRRDQSPIRRSSSHWRTSPLKPILSANRKLAMTHRSIFLAGFR